MDFMELSSQVVLQGYGQFLNGYTNCLRTEMDKFQTPWETNENLIRLRIYNEDHTPTLQLINCDNQEDIFIIHLFITLIKDINTLKRDLLKNHLPKLKYCGEVHLQQASSEGYHIIISHVLPVYFDVLSFVRRCREFLLHVLEQLVRVYNLKGRSDGKKFNTDLEFICLDPVYQAVGDLLLVFVSLDASIASYHREVEPLWNMLKQSVVGASGDLSQEDLKNLLMAMAEVQGELLTGLVFNTAVNSVLNEKSRFDPQDLLNIELNRFLENQSQELEYVDQHSSQAMDNCAKVLSVFAFALQVYTIRDKKVKKFVSGFTKKFPGIALYSQVFWSPCQFVNKHLKQFSIEYLEYYIQDFENKLRLFVEEFSNNIKTRLKDFAVRTFHWSLKMENCASSRTKAGHYDDVEVMKLCFEGLQLCSDIKYTVICGSRFHFTLNKPVSKSLALSFCKMVELLRGVHAVFERHAMLVARTSHLVLEKVAIKTLSKISQSKKMLNRDKKRESHKRLYGTLCHAERIFYQSCSEERLILVSLLPSNPTHLVEVEYNQALVKCDCTQLETVVGLQTLLEETGAGLMGPGEAGLVDTYLRHVWEEGEVTRVRYLGGEEESALRKEVVQPLCELVETNLRLAALSHLSPDPSMPRVSTDLRRHLRSPLKGLVVRREVEKYLERTWHDLLTVSLHDWAGYREMRLLGETRLGLTTVEDRLPCVAPSQGHDVLRLVRDIHDFVTQYHYNINSQSFVQLSSNNKHLNTISPDLLAASLRTHGSGILNTTTNLIYRYLRNKLVTFCQYLYDDNIKCRLIKDFNHLKEERGRVYTWERGEKMLKSGRRVGEGVEGLRALVAQVGNALGLVRLVGTSARHGASNTASFLPACPGEHCLRLLERTAPSASPRHLSLLVDVFARAFASGLDSTHAPLFALMVPPLTLCHVRHMVATKERLAKRARSGGASFADDGFPLGLAYLLRALRLTQLFDSLRWFQTVATKYKTEQNNILSSAEQVQDNNTLKLSIKRLQLYKQEFELLHYNLKSAHIILSSS